MDKRTILSDMEYETNRNIWHRYNQIVPSDTDALNEILHDYLGHIGENSVIRQPFLCDIGKMLFVGDNCYVNYGLTVLGSGEVRIGNNVGISSGVTIIAIDHPSNPCLGEWIDIPKNVTIKDGAWIGANVTVLGDVTIGENSIVGAGSVVTTDVPPNTTVVGIPAKPMNPSQAKKSVMVGG